MDSPIIQLYPQPSKECALKGAYLAHDLRQYGSNNNRAFIYTNYIVSLDGRIAIRRDNDEGMTIPKSTANDRDWRLFQELAAQADLIISSGRYLCDWAEGKAQDILQVDDPQFADLRGWRQARGLSPQADIAIVSNSLNFPIPEVLTASGRNVVIFTTDNPDPACVQKIEEQAGQVIVAGDEKGVDGALMVDYMTDLGYRTIFSSAGPQILHLLLASDMLDRLYLTHASRILGGDPFASIVKGGLLEPAVDMTLNSLYLDPTGLDGLGQLFAAYART